LAELVSAAEQCCQELVDRAAVLAETTLADECCHQEAAERGATLGETVLAKERCCSLMVVQAEELVLAAEQSAVS
jgi:hypothetical protein